MTFLADSRGVSEVVGALMMFTILIIMIGIWQAQGVPAQNTQAEFEHYKSVQNDLAELRAALLNAGVTNTTRSTSIQLGVSYPSRVFFVNPPPPQGHLLTTIYDNGTYLINGKNHTNFCNLEEPVPGKAIKYSINYNYFTEDQLPPFILGNTILYQPTESQRAILRSDQTLVQNSKLNIYLITSNLSQRGVTSVSVDIHANARTFYATETVNLSIPTRLNASQWERVLPADVTVMDQPGERVLLVTNIHQVQCTAIGLNEPPRVTPDGGSPINEPPAPEPEGPYFNVTIDATNDPITSGDTFEANITVTNTGDEQGTQTIKLNINGINGNPQDTQTLTLAPGESQSFTLKWDTSNNAHSDSPYTAEISSQNETETTEVVVNNPGQGQSQ